MKANWTSVLIGLVAGFLGGCNTYTLIHSPNTTEAVVSAVMAVLFFVASAMIVHRGLKGYNL